MPNKIFKKAQIYFVFVRTLSQRFCKFCNRQFQKVRVWNESVPIKLDTYYKICILFKNTKNKTKSVVTDCHENTCTKVGINSPFAQST